MCITIKQALKIRKQIKQGLWTAEIFDRHTDDPREAFCSSLVNGGVRINLAGGLLFSSVSIFNDNDIYFPCTNVRIGIIQKIIITTEALKEKRRAEKEFVKSMNDLALKRLSEILK